MGESLKIAYFAGGCFWCMVSPFDVLKGIKEVNSGYMGGGVTNPSYEQVKSQMTGHYEVIQVIYDEEVINYNILLEAYWRQVDPTDNEGQFQDRGSSYRPAIFYTDEVQRRCATESKYELNKSNRFELEVITPIIEAKDFYLAEDYHQNYYKKNADDYYEDRSKSGRDEFILKYWGDDYYTIYEEALDEDD